MAENDKNKGSFDIDLQQQHKEIAQYLRSRFRQFIKAQSQDFDSKGNRLPAFTENSKTALIRFFEIVCDSFGRSYRQLQDAKKLKDPAETSNNVKRLNLFLLEFCREHGIDNEHPIQLFTEHEVSDRRYQVHLHLACARTGFTNRNRSYSTDNILLEEALKEIKQVRILSKQKQNEAAKPIENTVIDKNDKQTGAHKNQNIESNKSRRKKTVDDGNLKRLYMKLTNELEEVGKAMLNSYDEESAKMFQDMWELKRKQLRNLEFQMNKFGVNDLPPKQLEKLRKELGLD